MINKEMAVEIDKTVRESYTLPRNERERLVKIQNKFSGIKPSIKKSEIVRVGIYKVEHLEEKDIKKILEDLGRLSVGKPKKVVEQYLDEQIIINDKQWEAIAQLFTTSEKMEGRPKAEPRQVLNGILYIFQHKIQRRNVPKKYSSYATCRRSLFKWRKTRLWKQICNSLVNNVSNEQKKELTSILLRTWLIEINLKIQ